MLDPAAEKTTTLYLLGITHAGLTAEYDEYFRARVVPTFRSADTFSFEGAGGREDEALPACDEAVLDANGRKKLAAARVEIAKLMDKAYEANYALLEKKGVDLGSTKAQRALATRTYVNGLDEFALIETQKSFAEASAAIDMQKRARKPSAIASSEAKGSVVYELQALRPGLKPVDLDSKFGARRAYCNSGKERIHFLETQLRATNIDTTAVYTQKMYSEMYSAVNDEIYQILSGNRHPPANRFLTMLDKTVICQRNQEWIHDMLALADGKTHFVAVGATHLFAVNHDDAHCPGLLSDLTALGWRVERIEATTSTPISRR